MKSPGGATGQGACRLARQGEAPFDWFRRAVSVNGSTYLFGAMLPYGVCDGATARIRGIRCVRRQGSPLLLWRDIRTHIALTAGDTVDLQAYFRVADGDFVVANASLKGAIVDQVALDWLPGPSSRLAFSGDPGAPVIGLTRQPAQ